MDSQFAKRGQSAPTQIAGIKRKTVENNDARFGCRMGCHACEWATVCTGASAMATGQCRMSTRIA
jgi:hypothetical protein